MDKTIKLLEEFLKDYTMEGVCGFWVEPDEEGEIPSVYIIFDLYWIQSLEISRASFVTRRMRQGLKEDIKNWTGIDVSYVGSIAKKCDNTKDINESISTHLLRRLPFEGMKQDIDNLVDYERNPCEISDNGDFVGEACDMLVNNYIEELEVSPKEKDDLYIYFVDLFGKHLVNVYKKRCVKGLKESKKRIVVTESQYKRLFEEKQSKKELFQELIDEKLQYIKDSCQDINAETFPSDVGFTSCEFADMIESIDVTEVNMMTGSRTDMYGNMYDTTPSVFIKLMVNYRTIRNYYNFDEIIFDIKYMLRKSTGGLPIVLDYQVNNLKTDKEW